MKVDSFRGPCTNQAKGLCSAYISHKLFPQRIQQRWHRMSFPPPPPGFMPPPPPGMPPQNNASSSRMPPEGILLYHLYYFLCLTYLRFASSHRAENSKMGANAEKAIWRETQRRLRWYGQAGEWCLHCLLQFRSAHRPVGSPSWACQKNYQRPRRHE